MDSLSSKFFTGIVSSSDAATYNISVDPYSEKKNAIVQGIPLVSIFTSTLGFKECTQYPVGANVLCYHITAERCYILGIIPEADIGNFDFYSRTALKTADGNFDSQNTQGYADQGVKLITHNQNRPTDVVDGEHVIANEFGVLLGLFQQMAMLKGSELAQVQCFLLDDLVRVVSQNFNHFSALGEYNIWHDGKGIMAEFGATHLPQESLGSPTVTSEEGKPIFKESGGQPTPDDKSDYYEFEVDERVKAIERFKIFLGRLGDLMHLFIVRPDESAIRTLSGDLGGSYDKGLADVHFSVDGRISIRSVSSIVLEKTNWIRVPHRVRLPEDPDGDEIDDINYDNKDPFKFDNTYKYQNNPTAYFLQMRDCVAYLQDAYNYKNFETHKKDFQLSKSASDETNLSDITKVDPKTEVKFSDVEARRSGVYLMDNGGVMIKDAWGSAIVLEGGNVYIQPAKDLIEQPLRNYVLKAGQFASICARKDIDLSSTEESFRLKTQKVQYFYSDEQGIIFESNADTAEAPSPDDEAYDTFGGILFKAADSGIFSYGKTIFDRATDEALYKSKKMTVQSEGDDLYVTSDSAVWLLPEKQLFALSDSDITIASKSTVSVGGTSSTSIGQKGKQVDVAPHPGAQPAIFDGILECDDLVDVKNAIINDIGQDNLSPFQEDSKFDDVAFKFLSSDKYNLRDNEDYIPQTIAQQEDDAFSFLELSAWEENEVNGTKPYPGQDKFENFFLTCKLNNLQTQDNDVFSKSTEGLDSSPGSPSIQSLNNYTIFPD